MYPSILSHTAGGGLMVLSVLFAIYNFSKLRSLDTFKILLLLLMFSLVVSVHGLSHLGLESEYQYTPFNLWKFSGKKHQTI
jgi:hypothetical protein